MRHTNSTAQFGAQEPQGPLAPYFDLFAVLLQDQGYSQSYSARQTGLVADFSRWLKEEQVGVTELTPEHAKRYLQILSQRRSLRRGDACTLRRLLELLSQRCVIPSTTASSQATPIGRITEDYTSYLRQQRNLSDATVVGYLPFIRHFLMDRFGPGPIDFSALCAADVIGFISRQAARLIAKRAKTATSALRSFLGYLRYRGEIQCDLAAVVPTVPIWSMTGIPRAIATSDANAALAHCRRDTPVGCRDYAILLLLARLGLRAGEIVSLTLDSINWAAGSLTVTGKRGQPELLPLPSDVGEAIANYLQRGRPKSGHRALFLRAQAPVCGFNGPSAISCVVRHALERAGIDSPRKGAHQFRHALACQMLRQGATLIEIGALLRHRSPQTTAIYAKVDLGALRTLSLPWPGGAL